MSKTRKIREPWPIDKHHAELPRRQKGCGADLMQYSYKFDMIFEARLTGNQVCPAKITLSTLSSRTLHVEVWLRDIFFWLGLEVRRTRPETLSVVISLNIA